MRRPGHWPSPAALGLLRAALWDGDAAARAWHHVLATVDIETTDPGAARLLPLAQRNVRRLGLPDPWARRSRGVYRYWWAHNQVLLRLCAQAVAELEGDGVPTLVLKGVPLGIVYYEDPGLRPMSDFDVLVPSEHAHAALRILARLGWAPERRVDKRYTQMLHGVSLHDRLGRTLDLHWAIHEEDVRPAADDEAWASAVQLEVGGTRTRMLAPAPLLVHSLASGAKWAADPAVRWVADATLIVRRGDVDWRDFVGEVVRRRFVVRARAALAYLEAALGVSVPDAVSARLAELPVTFFERLEHQVRTRTHAHLGELPRYWLAWRRSSPGAWRDVAGFGSYLSYAWDLPSIAGVPAAAARRAAWRLATGRPAGRSGRSAADQAAPRMVYRRCSARAARISSQ